MLLHFLLIRLLILQQVHHGNLVGHPVLSAGVGDLFIGPALDPPLQKLDSGEFIVYPKSFLRFLFDMRGTFGFPTK